MKNFKVSLALITALIAMNPGVGFSASSENVESPQVFEELTLSFGARLPMAPLPGPYLNLYVWNIHKAKDPTLSLDFRHSSLGADLALFQEAINARDFTLSLTAANPFLGWTMAKSFSVAEETFTGVATGARVKAVKEEVIVSEPTEPVSKTHKTILISQYLVNWQADPLLVANIHAINFVPLRKFKIQIDQMVARVREHKGPMIIGGDFNTWNKGRMAYLRHAFEPLGLKLVETPSEGFLNLDHVFIRGLKARSVEKLKHITSSDHIPIRMELIFENFPSESHESVH